MRASFPKTAFPEAFAPPRGPQRPYPIMRSLSADGSVLERERHDRGLTIYKLKRQLSGHSHTVELPALERLRQAA